MATGKMITFKVLSRSPTEFTSTRFPARYKVRRGVRRTESKVEIEVRVTDNATSALAINVKTLDAVPPGQQATRISPTAKGVGKS